MSTTSTAGPGLPDQRGGRGGSDVEIRSLTKEFAGSTVLRDTNLSIAPGEIVALLGPSGCGKTTLLRCIAGLEQPSSGTIRLRGKLVFSAAERVDIPTEKRNVGMVFQSYALWPHMSVGRNIAYGLRHVRPPERQARVEELLELVGLAGFADRFPATLSGGQQQRVAFARCLSTGTTIVLLDEPLSNLDLAIRETMRSHLRDMVKQAGVTAILVTHDHSEALGIADRVFVMNAGRVVEAADPETLYLRPKTRFAAGFIGSANIIPVSSFEVSETPDQSWRASMLAADGVLVGTVAPPDGAADVSALLVRPEEISLSRVEVSSPNTVKGEVRRREFGGSTTTYFVACGSFEFRVESADSQVRPGDGVWLTIPQEHLVPLAADGAGD